MSIFQRILRGCASIAQSQFKYKTRAAHKACTGVVFLHPQSKNESIISITYVWRTPCFIVLMARFSPTTLLSASLALIVSAIFSACGDSRDTSLNAALQDQISGRWAPLPVTLYVSDEIATDSEMMNDVREAAAFWENAAQKTLFNLRTDWAGPTPPITGTYSDPTQILANLLFFVDPWPLAATAKGHTVLTKENEMFQNGVIYLQHGNYCAGACESATGKISFRLLVAHEFGHFLGLTHSTNSDDIMNAIIPVDSPLSSAQFNDAALQSLVR